MDQQYAHFVQRVSCCFENSQLYNLSLQSTGITNVKVDGPKFRRIVPDCDLHMLDSV